MHVVNVVESTRKKALELNYKLNQYVTKQTFIEMKKQVYMIVLKSAFHSRLICVC